MIVQPDRESRNVNEIFYENEARRIAELNEIFGEVELTAAERRTLVWLAGWEESTVVNVISAVRKAMAAEAKRQGLTPVRRTEKPSAERKGSFRYRAGELLMDGTAVKSAFALLSVKVTKPVRRIRR